MKKIFFITSLFVLSTCLFAQDQIINLKGDLIDCAITKVDSVNIYYIIIEKGAYHNKIINRNEIKDVLFDVTKDLSPDNKINTSHGKDFGKNNNKSDKNEIEVINASFLPIFSIGLGTGFNNFSGVLGISANLRIFKNYILCCGIGIGDWNIKSSVGLKIQSSNWLFGLGFSYCSGGYLYDNETTIYGNTKTVLINYLPVSTINITGGYS